MSYLKHYTKCFTILGEFQKNCEGSLLVYVDRKANVHSSNTITPTLKKLVREV